MNVLIVLIQNVIASKAKQSLSYNRDCHTPFGSRNDFSALFRHCEQSEAISSYNRDCHTPLGVRNDKRCTCLNMQKILRKEFNND